MKEFNWYGMTSFMPKEKFDLLDRETQLELIAFGNMTGEDVLNTLELVDIKLEVEYDKLVYGEDKE